MLWNAVAGSRSAHLDIADAQGAYRNALATQRNVQCVLGEKRFLGS